MPSADFVAGRVFLKAECLQAKAVNLVIPHYGPQLIRLWRWNGHGTLTDNGISIYSGNRHRGKVPAAAAGYMSAASNFPFVI